MKKILIVTDAWHPQVNGVVRSLERVSEQIIARGYDVHYLSPQDFRTLPMPGYSEIRLSVTVPYVVRKHIDDFGPDSIHIATEGPLGTMARRYCIKRRWPFATSYHTQFPEYVRARLPVPVRWTYRYLRRFHRAAEYCLVPTKTVKNQLRRRRFKKLVIWSRGVDTELFHPNKKKQNIIPAGIRGPIYLYVGRIAVEKNIDAFLDLKLDGQKIVVGEGPARKELARKHPEVIFAGTQQGDALAAYYASADCFVFPSLTDTFGLVLLEALACGTPVASFPVTGPIDVIGDSGVGVMADNLEEACLAATKISRKKCRDYAMTFSWAASADQFLKYLPDIKR